MENTPKSHPIRKIIDPGLMAVVLFTYALGVGIAHYLGAKLDWTDLLLGLAVNIFLLETRNFLSAYYDHSDTPMSTLHKDDPFYNNLRSVKRQMLLQIALTVLTAGMTVIVILIFRKAISAAGFLLIGTAFVISFFSASPPFRLEKNGYGELLEALFLATLIPAIAVTLQGKTLSYFLVMLTFPLALIYLAMKIAFSFEGYGYEVTHGGHTLTARLGWQKAMNLHNILIITAFILIGVFGLVGLSWSFVWPLLLGLPVGGYQIFLIQQIAEGAKPRWRLLRLVSAGLFLLMTYLIIVSLWIN